MSELIKVEISEELRQGLKTTGTISPAPKATSPGMRAWLEVASCLRARHLHFSDNELAAIIERETGVAELHAQLDEMTNVLIDTSQKADALAEALEAWLKIEYPRPVSILVTALAAYRVAK